MAVAIGHVELKLSTVRMQMREQPRINIAEEAVKKESNRNRLLLLCGGAHEKRRRTMSRIFPFLPKVFDIRDALTVPFLKRAPHNLCCL